MKDHLEDATDNSEDSSESEGEINKSERETDRETEDSSESDSPEEINIVEMVNCSLNTLKNPEPKLIFMHPEAVQQQTLRKVLREIKDLVGCVAIDEVHCITEW